MGLHTPLHGTHNALGATFTEFAGYDMPVHYGSINEEHLAVRSGVGLFDVSHMSNLRITGSGAERAISAVCPFSAAELPVGKGKYTFFLRQDGSILDDTFVFRLGPQEFFVIPNAGRNEATAHHVRGHATGDVRVDDESTAWAILALQGPKAKTVLQAASPSEAPKFHQITTMDVAGVACLVSGTGYTGEKGVELYVPTAHARRVWDHVMAAGAAHAIRPIGLGARDTLRLEKGYCLAGNEFAGGRTPVEANLSWAVDWEAEFLGKERLVSQRDSGDHDVLLGLVQEKGVPRHAYAVQKDGRAIGEVTSGTMSPSLGKGIALAYVRAAAGEAVDVDVRGRPVPARLVKPPFV